MYVDQSIPGEAAQHLESNNSMDLNSAANLLESRLWETQIEILLYEGRTFATRNRHLNIINRWACKLKHQLKVCAGNLISKPGFYSLDSLVLKRVYGLQAEPMLSAAVCK